MVTVCDSLKDVLNDIIRNNMFDSFLGGHVIGVDCCSLLHEKRLRVMRKLFSSSP